MFLFGACILVLLGWVYLAGYVLIYRRRLRSRPPVQQTSASEIAQLREEITRLSARTSLLTDPSRPEREELRAQIEQLQRQVRTIQVQRGVGVEGPTITYQLGDLSNFGEHLRIIRESLHEALATPPPPPPRSVYERLRDPWPNTTTETQEPPATRTKTS
ncbi:MAG: FlxA-like family protein, partial [Candidatus Dormibacteraceae bacterium]